MPRSEAKSKTIKVRVTPERYETYANRARGLRTTVSTLARNGLDRECGRDVPVAMPVPHVDDSAVHAAAAVREFTAQLRPALANVNQIAKAMNIAVKTGDWTQAGADSVDARLTQTNAILQELMRKAGM